MATAQEMADFHADMRALAFDDAKSAIAVALAFDFEAMDQCFLERLATASVEDGWVNHMQRDKRGRLLWLRGHDGKATVSYQASEWPDGPPSHDAGRRGGLAIVTVEDMAERLARRTAPSLESAFMLAHELHGRHAKDVTFQALSLGYDVHGNGGNSHEILTTMQDRPFVVRSRGLVEPKIDVDLGRRTLVARWHVEIVDAQGMANEEDLPHSRTTYETPTITWRSESDAP